MLPIYIEFFLLGSLEYAVSGTPPTNAEGVALCDVLFEVMRASTILTICSALYRADPESAAIQHGYTYTISCSTITMVTDIGYNAKIIKIKQNLLHEM